MSGSSDHAAHCVFYTGRGQREGICDCGFAMGLLANGVKDFVRSYEDSLQEAKAKAWWEGVNDQWKHLPQGNRLLESANPYRVKA